VKTKVVLLLLHVCVTLGARAGNMPDILWADSAAYGYVATGVAVSPDGQYAACPGSNGVQIKRVSDGSNITSLTYGAAIANLAFSRDGAYLLAAGGSPAVSVWRVSNWASAYSLSNVLPGPAAFSPDSALLAVASNSVIQLRSATDGAMITSWNSPVSLGAINTLAFSPDRARLASGAGIRGSDLNLKIWSVPSGTLLLNIPTAQTYSVGFATFSPDGRLVATAGGEYPYGPAQLWRVADGALMRTFPQGAFSVAFSPDSAMAIVAGTNLSIYGVATGALLSRYADAGSYYQRAVATTPDGRAFLRTAFPGQIFAARLPLWLNSFTYAGPNGLLSWSGGDGHYQLQQRTSLTDGAWQNVGGVLTNRMAEVPLQNPNSFYRVISLPN
jgi:WD40 repeat protein